MTPTKEQLQERLRLKLDETISLLNQALTGNGIDKLAPILNRIGKGQQIPHWYDQLKKDGTLPNRDGKTVGSVVEMILLAVLETYTFVGMNAPPLKINPARGVDFPDLDLGVKSPSENFCTSEPFYSAYERMLGSDHDLLLLLTDYQETAKNSPLKLKIKDWKYVKKTQIADRNLCRIAKKNREWLIKDNEGRAQRVLRFMAYVNQSDWRAKRILRLIDCMQDEAEIRTSIARSKSEFEKTNKDKVKKAQIPIADTELAALTAILDMKPLHVGIADAAENWVMSVVKDAARPPSTDEWKRFLVSDLEGVIGMSLALQWRYNFGPLFGKAIAEEED